MSKKDDVMKTDVSGWLKGRWAEPKVEDPVRSGLGIVETSRFFKLAGGKKISVKLADGSAEFEAETTVGEKAMLLSFEGHPVAAIVADNHRRKAPNGLPCYQTHGLVMKFPTADAPLAPHTSGAITAAIQSFVLKGFQPSREGSSVIIADITPAKT